MRTPGVIVLHDLVLHHLIVEMTLARGDVDGYVAALEANHGQAGAAWARGRAAGLHSEMGNFLLPASVVVANRSRGVIVHNRYAAERLQSFGVTSPIHVVPHPFEPQPSARGQRGAVRAQHQFAAGDRVIGLFGFLTSAKRAEVVLAAFAEARERDKQLRLLIVGEPAPNVDVDALRGDGITFTGYVPDEEFAAYFAAVDRLVNLRYPSAGETSGTLIRAFEAGKPVAVSDYAQFAEFPDDCVVKIPFGHREVELLADFFVRDLADPSDAQAKWLRENASMELTVRGYLAALEDTSRESRPAVTRTIPLFPKLDAALNGDTIVLRNSGDFTLRTRTYGEPGYRLMMLTFDGDAVIDDRWVELPRDLRPGDAAEVALPHARGTLRLYHAIEGIPMIAPEPFAELMSRQGKANVEC
jgi:glycosyltransferase involved in cell wall biosynthesis